MDQRIKEKNIWKNIEIVNTLNLPYTVLFKLHRFPKGKLKKKMFRIWPTKKNWMNGKKRSTNQLWNRFIKKDKRLWTKTMVKKGTVDFFTKQSGEREKKEKPDGEAGMMWLT